MWPSAVVERDAEEEAAAMAAGDNALAPADLPPQLMFVHQGRDQFFVFSVFSCQSGWVVSGFRVA
jgi:hypothetical protein